MFRERNRSDWAKKMIGIAIISCCAPSVVASTSAMMRQAEELVRQGSFLAAERIYDRILEEEPAHLEARLQRAVLRSWRGGHREAQGDFRKVLESQPHHLGALVGLAYDQAWDRAYRSADETFRMALGIVPDNVDALKGLAYSHLWSGQSSVALAEFEALRAKHPEDPEPEAAVGWAHLAQGHHQRARRAFERASELAPDDPDARAGLAALRDLPSPLEVNVWVGATPGGGRSGLRQTEIASWVASSVRVWARYDNSLSLDNPVLARSGRESDAVLGGLMAVWDRQWLTRLEVGRRRLAEGQTQNLYLPEVVFLSSRVSLKAGGALALGAEERNDWTGHFAVGLPVTSRWRIEPTVYLSRIGVSEDREWRAVVHSEYRASGGWNLGLGVGGGRLETTLTPDNRTLWTGHLQLSLPVGTYHRILFSTRYERSPLHSCTVGMVGMSLRLPRN